MAMNHENGTLLSCGCRLGSFQCPAACKLWGEVEAAYRAVLNEAQGLPVDPGLLAVYEEKRALYRAHFGEVSP